jgi:dipeptidyl aminopeptidase/acylaminoacyl peptidase
VSAGTAGAAGSAVDLEAVRSWVLDHLTRCASPAPQGVVDIRHVAVHPHRPWAACALLLRAAFAAPTRRQVGLVDLDSGALRVLDLPTAQAGSPAWSTEGRLVVIGAEDDGATAALVLEVEDTDVTVVARSDVPGALEACLWSPDGTRLALQVAMPGVELSDVVGSGTVPGAGPSWQPRVLPGEHGRRKAVVWDPGSGQVRDVGTGNVWELSWGGSDALLALTSDHADEGAWYAAVLTRLDLATGRQETLHRPSHQLAQPRSAPDGSRWSVLSGVQSDRGLPAGVLVLGGAAAEAGPVLTDDVHVTDHDWLDASTVQYTGLRGLDTVVATVDVPTRRVSTLWVGPQTSGDLRPEVAGAAGRPAVVVLEDPTHPPALGVLEEDGFRVVLGTEGDGSRLQRSRAGTTSRVSWTSTDGLAVQGLLTVPDGAGPHALVLAVHGGPTHAWRATWSGRDPHASALVARGYAVLRPNPRGSTGRGAAFAEGVYGDMGGLDLDDVVSGVQHLVDSGVADPTRLGVTGISYGGFLAASIPCRSDTFAASVARSPVTDWVTQHLTSNIAEFDRLFVGGDPFDPASSYTTRSPLAHHARIRTPMLLTAGLHDLATPASQAQVLHTALERRGVPTQLAIYPEEGHGVQRPEAVADQVARMVAWFERFMPPGRTAQPITDDGAPSGT